MTFLLTFRPRTMSIKWRSVPWSSAVDRFQNLTSASSVKERQLNSSFPYKLKVDSKTFEENGNVNVDCNIPGIFNVRVCLGGNGWPTPYPIGIYLDADSRSSMINWPSPCDPLKVRCRYGDFVIYMDTATEDEIASAKEETADFFRDD